MLWSLVLSVAELRLCGVIANARSASYTTLKRHWPGSVLVAIRITGAWIMKGTIRPAVYCAWVDWPDLQISNRWSSHNEIARSFSASAPPNQLRIIARENRR
jgi:hypothetical protein